MGVIFGIIALILLILLIYYGCGGKDNFNNIKNSKSLESENEYYNMLKLHKPLPTTINNVKKKWNNSMKKKYPKMSERELEIEWKKSLKNLRIILKNIQN